MFGEYGKDWLVILLKSGLFRFSYKTSCVYHENSIYFIINFRTIYAISISQIHQSFHQSRLYFNTLNLIFHSIQFLTFSHVKFQLRPWGNECYVYPNPYNKNSFIWISSIKLKIDFIKWKISHTLKRANSFFLFLFNKKSW